MSSTHTTNTNTPHSPTLTPISKPTTTTTTATTTKKITPKIPLHQKPSSISKWYTHITLDFLLSILSQTIFNPAIILLFYLCLAAVHKHRTWVAWWTVYFYTSLVVLSLLSWINQRITYGRARKVDWKDEVVVLTGGKGGLGRVLVELLVRGKGCRVAVLDLKGLSNKDGELRELVEDEHEREFLGGEEQEQEEEDGYEDLSGDFSGDGHGDENGNGDGEEREREGGMRRGLWWGVCDVGDLDQVKGMIGRIEKELGRPTILINNAAIPVHGLPLVPSSDANIPSLTPAQAANTLRVNTLAHFNTISALMPYLATAPNGGTIVTISSILALLSPSLLSDYSASKAALSSLHQTLTHEISRNSSRDIRTKLKTVLVEPGQLDTTLFSDLTNVPWYAHFFGPVLAAKDVAKEIVNQLEKGQSGVLRMPFYTKLIPAYGALPGAVQLLLRAFSGIDQAISRDPSRKQD